MITRRDFLKRGVLTAGVAALTASGLKPRVAQAQEAGSAVSCDVAVVGAGLAGLIAAARARELGARVVVIEKEDSIQKNNSWVSAGATLACDTYVQRKAGFNYTKEDFYRDLRKYMPWGDAAQQKVWADRISSIIDWLATMGLTYNPRQTPIGTQLMLTTKTVMDVLYKRISAGGVQFLFNTKATKIRQDKFGRVTGISVIGPTGSYEIAAKSVILATGGFQANNELITRYIHPEATRVAVRYAPVGTGDGLLMGLEIGAGTSQGMNSFYGHLVYLAADGNRPSLAGQPPSALSIKWDVQCVVVNVYGERFTDESDSSECIAQDALKQPESLFFPKARAFVIFDAPIYEEHKAEIEDAVKRGAVIAAADTLEGLADKLSAWGVYKDGLINTIKEFNEAVAAGKTGQLRVPKIVQREAGYVWKLPLINKIATPPFYALPAAPGLTFTEGGLQVGLGCEVLDRDQKPIPGLYAAGETAGGLLNRQYIAGSGIAKCLLQGYLAGSGAAQAARQQ